MTGMFFFYDGNLFYISKKNRYILVKLIWKHLKYVFMVLSYFKLDTNYLLP